MRSLIIYPGAYAGFHKRHAVRHMRGKCAMFHKTSKKRAKRRTSNNNDCPSSNKVYIMKFKADQGNLIEFELEPDSSTLSTSDQNIEVHTIASENIQSDTTVSDDNIVEQVIELQSVSNESIRSEQDIMPYILDNTSELVMIDGSVQDDSIQSTAEPDQDACIIKNESISNDNEIDFKEPGSSKKQAFSGWIANRHKLKFQQKWLTEFPFIDYDMENNLMFCKTCRKYVNDWRKTSTFIVGTDNFRESVLKYHERSSMHKDHQELADALSSEDSEAMDKDLYKDQLSHVFKSVYFILKNKMPYTHYPQLCESQKREGTDLCVYSTSLKVVPLFGKFIAMAFEKELEEKISNIPEFSLVIDASFQRNSENHDLVYLKYVDNFIVQTVFLGVIDSSTKLHDSMYNILTALFKKYNIDRWVDKVAYIMMDKSNSHMWFETFMYDIKSMSPQKFFSEVTYLSHKIKLCSSVVQNHKVTSTFDALLWSIYCQYERVDKAQRNLHYMDQELDEIIECYGNLPKNSYTTLYFETLKAVEKDYAPLVHLLKEQQLHIDFKIRKSGSRILSIITHGSFICKLALLVDIFSCLNDFAVKLSGEDVLPYDVHMLLDETCLEIEKGANGEGPTAIEIAEELSLTPGYFRGVEILEDSNLQHILSEVKKFSVDVISYLKSLVDESLLEKSFIFNVCMWPEDGELESFGNSEFREIFLKFNGKEIHIDSALLEWDLFKTKVLSLFPFEVRQNSKPVILKMASEYINEFPIVTAVLRKILLLNFESSEIKRGYHEMCLNKSQARSVLSLQSLQTAMMISMYGPSLNELDFSVAMELFLNSKHRQFRKKIIDKKLTSNSIYNEEKE